MARLEPKAGDDLKRLRQRNANAWEKRRLYDQLLREVWEYVIPYRTSGVMNPTAGQKLTDNLFDATGPYAAFSFAGRMQQEVTPPFQDFFTLEAGPLLNRTGDNKKLANEDLAEIGKQVSAALSTSNYSQATADMYLEFFAGTGAMLMLKGDARTLIRNLAVPIGELALELGPYGDIWGRYWDKAWPAWQVEEMWPDGVFDDELKQQIRSEQGKPIDISQATVWNSATQRWDLSVFRKASNDGKGKVGEQAIWGENFRTSPWITPRFWTVPGEVLGRGPGLLMLPFVKTLNKTREYELKAAALALFGIWTSTDEAFNSKTARYEPGAIWKVGSNSTQGRGPTLAKLDVPGRFDLSRVVAEEEREQIARIGLNRRLPPETAAVRSPTEIMARLRDLDIDLGGVYGRVVLEIVHPTAQRGLEILEDHGILESKIDIDQLTVGLKVTSPIANSQKAGKAKAKVDYMQVVSALLGPDTLALTMRLENALPQLGRDMGVEEMDLRSQGEAKEIREAIIERAAQIMAEEQMKQLGADTGASPEPSINGAALQ